ncbi:membrane protein [Staphylococcus microti]|uniref:Membrane protein n=1 Tax=Staphylococcus microti TaxID=569857 RepID=A0A0D6XU78_9STAP|nr:PTS sugar transporter subunit IIC [Staphylococcus microti]KIX91801.1 membrane protein [Staphylococcus microti]PNZ84431.1 PTS transporter subunit IIC [Staphylococcus microti]SUM58372.1 regulatory protein [Staphylococcus microti]
METSTNDKMTFKKFTFNVLNGLAVAIVVGLIPNAVLGGLFQYLGQELPFFTTLHHVVLGIQFALPLMVGVLIAFQFKLNPMETAVVGAAAYVGSGAAKATEAGWQIAGIGDLINTMITASIAVLMVLWLSGRLGSLTIILLPILVGGIPGLIGTLTLPYVSKITLAIGNLVNTLTTLQPVLMCILIAILFSFIIVSPVSTIAVGLAIGISGLAAGAAAIGVAAAAVVLFIGTLRVNKLGVPIAIILGGMKMMMPNIIRYPIMLLPIGLTAGVTGAAGALVGIEGTKESAGFGIVGLVGPIKALSFLTHDAMTNVLLVSLVFIIIPLVVGFIVNTLFCKVLKLYKPDIYRFTANEEN